MEGGKEMEANSRKHRFKKGRSATFSIDGFNITIVANEEGETSNKPLASFARSKSQSVLWNAITAGMGMKGKDPATQLTDLRTPEEILADELPGTDGPEATEKTAIRLSDYKSLGKKCLWVMEAAFKMMRADFFQSHLSQEYMRFDRHGCLCRTMGCVVSANENCTHYGSVASDSPS